jgi:hypothetical protein
MHAALKLSKYQSLKPERQFSDQQVDQGWHSIEVLCRNNTSSLTNVRLTLGFIEQQKFLKSAEYTPGCIVSQRVCPVLVQSVMRYVLHDTHVLARQWSVLTTDCNSITNTRQL